MHDLARFRALHDERGARSEPAANQVMVHRGDREQSGDGCALRISPPIAQDQDGGAFLHRACGGVPQPIEALAQSPFAGREKHIQPRATQAIQAVAGDRGEAPIAQYGALQLDLPAVRRLRQEELPCAPSRVRRDITSDSRIGSMGGLVTWAKSCLK